MKQRRYTTGHRRSVRSIEASNKTASRRRTWAQRIGAVVLVPLIALLLADGYGWVKDRLKSDPAVHVTLIRDPGRWEAGVYKVHEPFEYFFAKSVDDVAQPPRGTCYRRYGWARSNGGVDANRTEVHVVLQSDQTKPVLLERASVLIDKKQSAGRGFVAACPVGGATANARHVNIDLDRGQAAYQDGELNPISLKMLKFNQGETEVLDVVARARRGRYSWLLKLEFLVDGKPKTERVPDDGSRFVTVGTRGVRVVHPDRGRWRRGAGPPVAGMLSP